MACKRDPGPSSKCEDRSPGEPLAKSEVQSTLEEVFIQDISVLGRIILYSPYSSIHQDEVQNTGSGSAESPGAADGEEDGVLDYLPDGGVSIPRSHQYTPRQALELQVPALFDLLMSLDFQQQKTHPIMIPAFLLRFSFSTTIQVNGLVFGLLYPAYSSYKAVKTKNVREYVRWMMYWIVFALFMTVETFTDIFLSWFPFYYEIKMAFVVWLLSPYTRGASLLYRKCVHPVLSLREKRSECWLSGHVGTCGSYDVFICSAPRRPLDSTSCICPDRFLTSQSSCRQSLCGESLAEIDSYIVQAKERSYESVVTLGRKGLNIAATAAVQAATKVPTLVGNVFYGGAISYTTQSQVDSDSMDERWSDNESRTSARTRGGLPPKPMQRSQSLRVSKKKTLSREASVRSSKSRAKKKVVQSESEM
ncbi:unnamed protein product [Ranitomeya imitator]|uniref:Receptor expression-enhancing protein 4 n=1 Tax=Ranitomeya imitator TaxID=111125 RepID=A0ABN9MMZ3_9NEOB|nr:unnamed protein product [Ranitomeya imitator]